MKELIIFCILTCCYTVMRAQSEKPFYFWNKISFIFEPDLKLGFGLSTKTSYLVSKGIREMTSLDGSVYRALDSWLKLGFAFRLTQKREEGFDLYEYRPQFFLKTHDNGKSKLKVRTTNRLEYRIFNSGDNHFRYYGNLFVDFRFFSEIPSLYLGNELFTKLNGEGLHLVRFNGGIHILVRKNFITDVYYVRQESGGIGNWHCSNIIGLNLTFKIGYKRQCVGK